MATDLKHGTRTVHFFPPWFLTKDTLRKIEALLPYYYHLRFRYYFDRYGCVRCGRKHVVYCCSGLCITCNSRINDRLRRSDRAMRRRYDKGNELPCTAFLKKLNSARELLADLRGKVR
jgi:hypothetical protein